MRRVSTALSTPALRRLRLRLRDLLPSKCPEPAFEYLSLPPAVFLKRFAADFLVFNFGISHPS